MTPLPLTHVEWQQQVIDLAHAHGWRHLHVRRTVGRGRKWVTATNVDGWPDLLLWHPGRGGVVAVELKVGRDKPSDEQTAVLESLRTTGIPTFVWYPDDLPEATATHSAFRGNVYAVEWSEP